ncbi:MULTISPECIES: YcgL domain-containing protein [unclassified Thalassotalea]|uniref:YcgL domain-containing protein n=1 Tax=unclassified Thalassotalea TaxID=2614972 RepID=UPI0010801F39|nr:MULTISPECIES: YcgL domain-containing protein [unclassified Thalassotalea]NMP16590.1 YcgL domain-containing protein [Thalassotalea sp. Y01]QBY03060.1 YcgL domain-containing protein [Thalassotalea sp. HSM 43]
MICVIYRSSKKADTYLYITKRDDFSTVPEPLMQMFGTPNLVTMVNLAKRDKLALADIKKVKSELTDKGYYLQLPPPKEDLLKQHRKDVGVEDKDME